MSEHWATITAVRTLAGVCVVQFHSGEELRCTRSFARQQRIAPGQHVDRFLIPRLQETAAAPLALELARKQLSRKALSRAELLQHLMRAGLERSAAEQALSELEAGGELDDRQAASALAAKLLREDVDDWHSFRDRAGRRLLRRGFERGLVTQALLDTWNGQTSTPPETIGAGSD